MAVSQIILLVLGILVLAVVAYLLYTNFVTTGSTISAETCRAEATRACTGCQIAAGITTVTECKFDKENSVTKAKTNLARCEEQGNLRIKSSGVVDCTQYTGTGGTGVITPQPSPSGGTTALACTTCDKISPGTWFAITGGTTNECTNSAGEKKACPA